MTSELYKRYRPKSFRTVVGQNTAVKTLQAKIKSKKLPHAILLSGPSGVGKTTIARILAKQLNAGSNIHEMDAARNTGIDVVRRLEQRSRLAPLGSDCTVWIIDEAHQQTTPAQQAFLKLLEDTPEHVYFFLATTHPEKLIPTVRNRCTHVALKPISKDELEKLLSLVCKREGIELDDAVFDQLVNSVEGSARKLLVTLDALREHDNIEGQLSCIKDSETEREAIEICRILFKAKPNWNEMTKVLKGIEEEPERVRRMVLGYASSVMLKSPKLAGKASIIIEAFCDNYFDSGKAGLVQSCYEVIQGG